MGLELYDWVNKYRIIIFECANALNINKNSLKNPNQTEMIYKTMFECSLYTMLSGPAWIHSRRLSPNQMFEEINPLLPCKHRKNLTITAKIIIYAMNSFICIKTAKCSVYQTYFTITLRSSVSSRLPLTLESILSSWGLAALHSPTHGPHITAAHAKLTPTWECQKPALISLNLSPPGQRCHRCT